MVSDMRSNLISIVSHEFRTPLAVIMSTVSLLRLKGQLVSGQELSDRLAVIEKQTRCLNEMLCEMNFLNQDEIIGHVLKPSPVDITQFFFEIIRDINAVYPNHRPIEIIHADTCQEVALDSYLMRQIFVNLLVNAMKYSTPESPVLCSYACRHNTLRVTIKDYGIGIPEQEQSHLFDAFFRAQNVGKVHGTGLGMWIVRQAVDTMDGTITFESKVGVGTTFHITLPITE
jgi:signal transduction histidine kinase